MTPKDVFTYHILNFIKLTEQHILNLWNGFTTLGHSKLILVSGPPLASVFHD